MGSKKIQELRQILKQMQNDKLMLFGIKWHNAAREEKINDLVRQLDRLEKLETDEDMRRFENNFLRMLDGLREQYIKEGDKYSAGGLYRFEEPLRNGLNQAEDINERIDKIIEHVNMLINAMKHEGEEAPSLVKAITLAQEAGVDFSIYDNLKPEEIVEKGFIKVVPKDEIRKITGKAGWAGYMTEPAQVTQDTRITGVNRIIFIAGETLEKGAVFAAGILAHEIYELNAFKELFSKKDYMMPSEFIFLTQDQKSPSSIHLQAAKYQTRIIGKLLAQQHRESA
jgi:hypothetical protein